MMRVLQAGGLIIADKLGFRVTAWARRQGGIWYHISRFSGRTLVRDTNDVGLKHGARCAGVGTGRCSLDYGLNSMAGRSA